MRHRLLIFVKLEKLESVEIFGIALQCAAFEVLATCGASRVPQESLRLACLVGWR